MLPSKKEIIVSIPYPLDPVKGHPPAKKDSIGAKRFREGWVPPPKEAELVETVQQLPSHRITQKPVSDVDQQSTAPHSCVCPPAPAEETPRIMQTVVIDDDEEEEESVSSSIFIVTSETVEEITIEDDNGDKEESEIKKDKLKALKRKMIPSRKSPRIKIPKLDIQKGVKTGLPKNRKLVESLAKDIMKNLKKPQSQLPVSKESQGQPSSSSSSSHVSGKQRSVLEMNAQAALWIAHPAQASGSQRDLPAAGRIAQKLKKPQSAAAAALPPVSQSCQSHPLHLSQLVLLLLIG